MISATQHRHQPNVLRPVPLPRMFRLLAYPALVGLLVSLARAADTYVLKMSESAPSQCDTINLSWTGGTPNYTVLITTRLNSFGGSVSILDAFDLVNSSLTWTANRCGGVPITITGSDSGGFKTTFTFTLKTSTNTSCLSETEQRSCHFYTTRSTSSHPSTPTSTITSASRDGDANQSATLPLIITFAVLAVVFVVACAACTRVRRRRAANMLRPGECMSHKVSA